MEEVGEAEWFDMMDKHRVIALPVLIRVGDYPMRVYGRPPTFERLCAALGRTEMA